MNRHPDASPADEWRRLLQGVVAQEPAWWMPPGDHRMDWMELEALAPRAAVAKLAGLFGPRLACEFPLPTGDVSPVLAAFLERVPDRPVAPDVEDAGFFLGFPYVWVPPRAQDGLELPPVLLPLARLPVTVERHAASAQLIIRARLHGGSAPGEVEPNPVLLHWLEQVTGRPLDPWLVRMPRDPWRRIPYLAEAVASALGLPAESARTTTAFRPLPALGELPFAPAILPAAVLGTFPAQPPTWQEELRTLLAQPTLSGPAGRLLGTSPSPSPDARPSTEPAGDASSGWAGNPSLARIGEQARTQPLTVVHAADAEAAMDVASGLVLDHLVRGERVLVVSDPLAGGDRLQSVLAAMGLDGLYARGVGAGDGGLALRQRLVKQLATTPGSSAPALTEPAGSVDRQHQERLQRLVEAAGALHQPGPDGRSFHVLAGEWLELVAVVPAEPGEPELPPTIAEVEATEDAVDQVLSAAHRIGWADSPWRDAVAIRPEVLRATSLGQWERIFEGLLLAAEQADRVPMDDVLPFAADVAVEEQIQARIRLADTLEPLVGWDRPLFCRRVATAPPVEVEALARQRETLVEAARDLAARPLDPGLWASVRESLPSLASIAQSLQVLEAEGSTTTNKASLGRVLSPLGLGTSAADARRAATFFRGLSHRLQLTQMVTAWLQASGGRVLDDARLRRDWDGTGALLGAMAALGQPALACVQEAVLAALQDEEGLPGFVRALRSGAQAAEPLAGFERAATATRVFAPAAFTAWRARWNDGEPRQVLATRWHRQARDLPEVLALMSSLAGLPPRVGAHARWHATRGTSPEIARLALRRAAYAGELKARRQQDPQLRDVTRESLRSHQAELSELSRRRQRHLTQTLRRNWSFRRLNQAPDASSASIASGLALIEQRPVWEVTPEQGLDLFAPGVGFDLVLFLQGSRCPLSEALPLMQRGRRAVVLDGPSAAGTVPAREPAWELPTGGPSLLAAARSVPGLEVLTTSGLLRPPVEAPFELPRELPYSRVHPHPLPSRTVAAVGALWSHQHGICNEVHWSTPTGGVDLVLVDPNQFTPPRVGVLVDLPHPTVASVSEWIRQWETLLREGWQIHPLWTPELVEDDGASLASLAAECGILSAPPNAPEEPDPGTRPE